MCEKCEELSKKYLGQYTEEQQLDILWSLTAFPFALPDQLEEQLKHIAEVGLEQARQEVEASLGGSDHATG